MIKDLILGSAALESANFILEWNGPADSLATSYEEAVTFYCIHHTEAWGSLPPAFTAREADRSSLTGPLAILRDQLEGEITGVAQWNRFDGWRILPPDWEPPIV